MMCSIAVMASSVLVIDMVDGIGWNGHGDDQAGMGYPLPSYRQWIPSESHRNKHILSQRSSLSEFSYEVVDGGLYVLCHIRLQHERVRNQYSQLFAPR